MHRDSWLDKPQIGRLETLLLGIGGILAIGAIDYATGYEVRLFPLYFLPIAFVGWRLSRPFVLGMAVLSSLTWAAANLLAGKTYTHTTTWPINTLSQLTAFTVIGLLVSDLRRRLRAEEKLSRRDPLTDLPNSRAFYEHGDMLLAIARRTARPVTVAYMDLDNFKQVNDVQGHLEGDRALIEAARVLQGHFRESDLVARLGGDEFASLQVETNLEAARASLERVRDKLVAAMKHNGWPITVSVGGASYSRAPAALEEAIHHADSLMYRAKMEGKNQVCIEDA